MPTKQEFLSNIRAKYPVYNDKADDELFNAIITKYPVYKDQITDYVDPNAPKPSYEVPVEERVGVQEREVDEVQVSKSPQYQPRIEPIKSVDITTGEMVEKRPPAVLKGMKITPETELKAKAKLAKGDPSVLYKAPIKMAEDLLTGKTKILSIAGDLEKEKTAINECC